MLDFSDAPKQWLVSRDDPGAATAGRAHDFAGLHVRTAEGVPVLRLRGADGRDVGRVIGWAIADGTFHRTGAELTLPEGTTPEAFYATLGGRFVMLWSGPDGRVLFREDPSGALPASVAPEAGVVASTVMLLDQLLGPDPDPETAGIFDFPARRGFLPFGLTARRGARRLMPNHVLDLGDFSIRRVWPDAAFCARPEASHETARALAEEAAEIVRGHLAAILAQGETVLYLSGGHDSRMVLAAARGRTGGLRCETIGDEGSLDVHVSRAVAEAAGVPHRTIPILPAAREEVEAWLRRTGYSMYDPVSELVATVKAYAPSTHPLSGTGAELARASNWSAEDVEAPEIDLKTLLARLRLPEHPAVLRAGQAWLDGLPRADAAMVLDLAKIEQIHACWSGAAVYGHPIPLPSLNPFSGQRWNEIALSLPRDTRMSGRFFRDFMAATWPELAAVPINRAAGTARLRFWKSEVKRLVPPRLKRWLKPFR